MCPRQASAGTVSSQPINMDGQRLDDKIDFAFALMRTERLASCIDEHLRRRIGALDIVMLPGEDADYLKELGVEA